MLYNAEFTLLKIIEKYLIIGNFPLYKILMIMMMIKKKGVKGVRFVLLSNLPFISIAGN